MPESEGEWKVLCPPNRAVYCNNILYLSGIAAEKLLDGEQGVDLLLLTSTREPALALRRVPTAEEGVVPQVVIRGRRTRNGQLRVTVGRALSALGVPWQQLTKRYSRDERTVSYRWSEEQEMVIVPLPEAFRRCC